MTETIKKLILSQGLLICPICKGDGEVGYFCGHETTVDCYHCDSRGIIRSLNKQKHTKQCIICKGGGGLGCCDNKGFQEWESYELYTPDHKSNYKKCENCNQTVNIEDESGHKKGCDYVWGRRGWRQLGAYDG